MDEHRGDPMVFPRVGRVRGPVARSTTWWGRAWVRSFEETALDVADLQNHVFCFRQRDELLGFGDGLRHRLFNQARDAAFAPAPASAATGETPQS